jgi:DNA-binding MarR family transcriptional regulator
VYVQQISPAADVALRMRESCLGSRVGRLHRIIGRHFDEALRPLGLSLSQMEILSALTLIGGPVKPSVVAEILVVERSTMSRNLTLLEQRGLVETTDHSASGRSLAVAITGQGTSALADAQSAWTKAQAALVDVLGDQVPATLDQWLDHLH